MQYRIEFGSESRSNFDSNFFKNFESNSIFYNFEMKFIFGGNGKSCMERMLYLIAWGFNMLSKIKTARAFVYYLDIDKVNLLKKKVTNVVENGLNYFL